MLEPRFSGTAAFGCENNDINGQTTRCSLIESLFPCTVVGHRLATPNSTYGLRPEERASLGAAVPSRIQEFAAGRLCAHGAMREIGIPDDSPLLKGPHREPLWPTGVVGSITHTEGFCASVVAHSSVCASLGIDAEHIGKVGTDLWNLVFTEPEQAALHKLDDFEQAKLAALLFSAKEAFFKSQFPHTAAVLEFTTVALRLVGKHGDRGGLELTYVGDVRLEGFAEFVVFRYALLGTLALVGATVPLLK